MQKFERLSLSGCLSLSREEAKEIKKFSKKQIRKFFITYGPILLRNPFPCSGSALEVLSELMGKPIIVKGGKAYCPKGHKYRGKVSRYLNVVYISFRKSLDSNFKATLSRDIRLNHWSCLDCDGHINKDDSVTYHLKRFKEKLGKHKPRKLTDNFIRAYLSYHKTGITVLSFKATKGRARKVTYSCNRCKGVSTTRVGLLRKRVRFRIKKGINYSICSKCANQKQAEDKLKRLARDRLDKAENRKKLFLDFGYTYVSISKLKKLDSIRLPVYQLTIKCPTCNARRRIPSSHAYKPTKRCNHCKVDAVMSIRRSKWKIPKQFIADVDITKHSGLVPFTLTCKAHGKSVKITYSQLKKGRLSYLPKCECSLIYAGPKLKGQNNKIYFDKNIPLVGNGYEPEAYYYLRNLDKRIKICVEKIHGTPSILLPSGGYHYPDMYLPRYNEIIEVKSTFTAGILAGNRYYGDRKDTQFARLKVKAKAATIAGYIYTVLVVIIVRSSPYSQFKIVELPANWVSMTKKQCLSYVKNNLLGPYSRPDIIVRSNLGYFKLNRGSQSKRNTHVYLGKSIPKRHDLLPIPKNNSK